jgi:predicted acyltransferase
MSAKPLQNRYLAIDVMRGLTLALMIIVNMSTSNELSYSQLLHATWFGFTLTDLVFPTFLFVVGSAMAFTMPRYENIANNGFLKKTTSRALLIFIFGFIVSNFPFLHIKNGEIIFQNMDNLRFLGVLQRIGICFALASFIIHFAGDKGALIYSILSLLLYWLIMVSFGDLSLGNNAALKVDLSIIGSNHLYKGEGIPFDPEGLLGIIPSLTNLLSGYLVVNYLLKTNNKKRTIFKIFILGIGLVIIANIWAQVFPISKKLWTSSYTCLTIGIDCIVLCILVYIIDIFGARKGTYYFEVFGKNTLFIYIFAEILMAVLWTIQINGHELMMILYNNIFAPIAPVKIASLLFSLTFMQMCWFIAYWMDKKKIYIRI